MGLKSQSHCGLTTALEGLPKFEDHRHGDFIGKGSYGEVFKHNSRHSIEGFAVKVVAFPKITRVGREDMNEQMFRKKMAYIDREMDILLQADSVSFCR